MVTGVVIIKAERKRINEVAEKVVEIEGISEVYSVSGQFDMLAIIRVKNNDQLAEIVTNHLLLIDGIVSSETHLAYKVYSKHDLESMFSIGLEDEVQ